MVWIVVACPWALEGVPHGALSEGHIVGLADLGYLEFGEGADRFEAVGSRGRDFPFLLQSLQLVEHSLAVGL